MDRVARGSLLHSKSRVSVLRRTRFSALQVRQKASRDPISAKQNLAVPGLHGPCVWSLAKKMRMFSSKFQPSKARFESWSTILEGPQQQGSCLSHSRLLLTLPCFVLSRSHHLLMQGTAYSSWVRSCLMRVSWNVQSQRPKFQPSHANPLRACFFPLA
jgi:hypothetical protein